MFRPLALICAFLLFSTPAEAAVDPALFSDLNGKAVIDDANIIDDNVEEQLSEVLAAFSRENGRQMAIVTVPSLEGYDIAEFTLEYARHLGIGSKELNDGLVLLIAPNERKLRIEVGYGLEWAMTDLQAGDTIDIVKPYFQAGDYTGGTVAITNVILQQITPAAEQRAIDNAARQAEQNRKFKAFMLKALDWFLVISAIVAAGFLAKWIKGVPARRRFRRKSAWRDFLYNAHRSPRAYIKYLKHPEYGHKTYKEFYNEAALRETILNANPKLITEIPNPTANERMDALEADPFIILDVENPTENEVFHALCKRPDLLRKISVSESMLDRLFAKEGMAIKYITSPTAKQIEIALAQDPRVIQHIEQPTYDQRISAFSRNGMLIQHYRDILQDPNRNVERETALKSDPEAIKYLSFITPEEVALALSAEPEVLPYVIEYASTSQIDKAVRTSPHLIVYLDNPSAALQSYAIECDIELSRKISNPTKKTLVTIAHLDEIENQKAIERERRRQEQRKREEEEEKRRQERLRSISYSSSYSSGSYGSSSSYGGFSGGGGSFGGGGASGGW